MNSRYAELDGWRGISILFVLAGHWFPIGPKSWLMNGSVASSGMVLFFVLSGFLITNLLLREQQVIPFLIRRFMRIVPLAWLVLIISLILVGGNFHQWISNLLFFANWPPMGLTKSTGHFWSLCLEMQFYLFIALLVSVLKKKAFYLLPIFCLATTGNRIFNDIEMAINTYYRADEILVGCCLALLNSSDLSKLKKALGKLSTTLLLLLLLASAHSYTDWLNYLRPYIAMALIGSSLYSTKEGVWYACLRSRFLFYFASISYAVYVFHGGLGHTWLGSGETLEKYLKRPLLLAVTIALAHISTNHYEKYWISLGKKLSAK